MIFVIDDDLAVLKALTRLLGAAGYTTKSYSSSERFIDEHDPTILGCIVLDLSMPRLNGLDVQQLLTQLEIDRPIIFLTGHGEIAAIVQAMKAGAIDCLLKPVNNAELFGALRRAQEQERACAERRTIRSRLAKLTPRETEVLNQVVAGLRNKQIAYDLGITERTTKVHRTSIMGKLGVRHMAQLVRMVGKVRREYSALL